MMPTRVTGTPLFSRGWERNHPGRGALLVAVTLVLTMPLAMASQALHVESTISGITVFPDRAEVTRLAELNLAAGFSVVEFSGLPFKMEPDSLRISAEGVDATLGALELKEIAKQPEETQELIAARLDVRKIQGELSALDGAEQVSQDLREFLRALKATTAQRESERLGAGQVDAESINALYGLLSTRLDELASGSLRRQEKRAALLRDLKLAQARLATMRPERAIRSRSVSVEIDLPEAGRLALRLQYVTPGAAWRPSYGATLDPVSGEVELVSQAVVSQSTGEDWTDVDLRLSTASPVRGVRPPHLPSLLLQPVDIRAQLAEQEMRKRSNVLGARAEDFDEIVDGVSDQEVIGGGFAGDRREAGAQQLASRAKSKQSAILRSAYNVTFQVPGTSVVPADGRDHRVTLRHETLAGEIEYHTVPSLNAAAFLSARTKAPGDYPLLRGPVRVFASGAYLGSFILEETGPQADLLLPFGIDNRIAVVRVPLPGRTGESGLLGKERRIFSAHRTTIENRRQETVTIILEERIPYAEDDRIRVQAGKETTPGWEEDEDRPGILRWRFELAPQEKREFVLAYSLRYPRDLAIVRVPGN